MNPATTSTPGGGRDDGGGDGTDGAAAARRATPATTARLPRSTLALLLALHLLPFATRPALVGGDEPHYALAAHSLATDRDLVLADEYADVAAGSRAAGRKRAGDRLDAHTRAVAGRELFRHPVGLPLLVAPLVATQQAIAPGAAPDLLFGGLGLAATFAALLAGWRALTRHLGRAGEAALWAFGGYLSSPLWFYSRTFFTEPYTWAAAVGAVAAQAAGRVALASLLLGVTVLLKETAAILAAVCVLGAAVRQGGRAAALLAVGPAVAAAGFVAKNLLLGVPPLTTFQPFDLGEPLRGAAGLLVDAAHGLVPFAPLLALGTLGWFAGRWRRHDAPLRVATLAAFALYFALSAAWADWRGGSCYGPRLLLPAMPALVVAAAHLATAERPRLRRLAGALFVAGFTVNALAALDPRTAFWGAGAGALLAARPVVTAAMALAGAGLLAMGVRLARALDGAVAPPAVARRFAP